MNPNADDDGSLTRNGAIDSRELRNEGGALRYKSSDGEPTLGTCALTIRSIAPIVGGCPSLVSAGGSVRE